MKRRLRMLRSNNGSPGLWDPRFFSSSLTALYLPGVGQTNVSGNCSQWDDQSGNGNTLSQGTSTFRPTLNSDGSVTGDGSVDYLQTAAFGVALSQPYVITVLARQDSWTNGDTIFDRRSGGPTTFAALYQVTSSPNVALFGTSAGPETLTTWPIGAYAVIQCVFNGASSSITVNNGTAITGGNVGVATLDGFTLLGRNDLANFAAATIKGVSIRSANDANVNAQDRAFWMRKGGIV